MPRAPLCAGCLCWFALSTFAVVTMYVFTATIWKRVWYRASILISRVHMFNWRLFTYHFIIGSVIMWCLCTLPPFGWVWLIEFVHFFCRMCVCYSCNICDWHCFSYSWLIMKLLTSNISPFLEQPVSSNPAIKAEQNILVNYIVMSSLPWWYVKFIIVYDKNYL